jgi:hypothetical protein
MRIRIRIRIRIRNPAIQVMLYDSNVYEIKKYPPNFYFSYDVKDVVNSLGGIQVLFPILESAASFTTSAASTPPTAAEDAAFLPSSQVGTTL